MKSQNEPNSSLHHQLLFNLKYLSTSMKFHKIMKTKKNNNKLVYITKMGEEVLLKLYIHQAYSGNFFFLFHIHSKLQIYK